MKQPPDLPLLPVPSPEWQAEYDALMQDPYLRRKYDRQARIIEHWEYLNRLAPEVLTPGPEGVMDIGCGPGEGIELCKSFGRDATGVEPPTGTGGMGTGYHRLSQLIHERQGIHVSYCGWQELVEFLLYVDLPSELAFLSRGSWEQCYSEHLVGDPHHVHHDCHLQTWDWSFDLGRKWKRAFDAMVRCLVPGGFVLIWANGTGPSSGEDQQRYDTEIRKVAESSGLVLDYSEPPRLHRWRKP